MVPYISIVIPVCNEEGNIINLWNRLRAVLHNYSLDKKCAWEVIFTDDGSRDNSLVLLQEIIRHEPAVSIVEFNKNYGQHAATLAAFAAAQGKIIITIDADLQNPPEEIPKLIAKLEEGYDVVGGLRQEYLKDDHFFDGIQSKMINAITRRATGVALHDYGCRLRAYRREIIDAMLLCKERYCLIPVLANTFAKHITEIPVQYSKRTAGKSKYNFWQSINLQFDLLTSFTIIPLRIFSIMGIIITALNTVSIIITLIYRMVHYEDTMHDTSLLFNILFFCIGAQFLAFGLIGEYIGRIYQEVCNRPRYVIKGMHKNSMYKP